MARIGLRGVPAIIAASGLVAVAAAMDGYAMIHLETWRQGLEAARLPFWLTFVEFQAFIGLTIRSANEIFSGKGFHSSGWVPLFGAAMLPVLGPAAKSSLPLWFASMILVGLIAEIRSERKRVKPEKRPNPSPAVS